MCTHNYVNVQLECVKYFLHLLVNHGGSNFKKHAIPLENIFLLNNLEVSFTNDFLRSILHPWKFLKKFVHLKSYLCSKYCDLNIFSCKLATFLCNQHINIVKNHLYSWKLLHLKRYSCLGKFCSEDMNFWSKHLIKSIYFQFKSFQVIIFSSEWFFM